MWSKTGGLARSLVLGLVVGVSAALAGCGSSDSSSGPGTRALDCASIEGPVDAAQVLLIEQLAARLSEIPQLGETLSGVVVSTAFLLDAVDALALFTTELLIERAPGEAIAELSGVGLSVQCFAVNLLDTLSSLAAGLGSGPLAGIPGLGPVLDILLTDLSLLVGDLSAALSGDLNGNIVGALAGRLAGIANNLIALARDVGSAAPGNGTEVDFDLLSGVFMLPAALLGGLGETLNGFADLDPERAANGLVGLVEDLVGIVTGLLPLPGFPGDGSLGALENLLESLSGGVALVLSPLFEALGAILPLGNGGQVDGQGLFSGFFKQGVVGQVDPVNVAWMKGGVGPDGVERPSLDSVLAGIPVLGDLLANVLGFEGIMPVQDLLRGLLLGDGDGLLPTLGDALAQVPGVPTLTPALTLVGDVLVALLSLDLAGIPVVQNVLDLVISGDGAQLVGGLVGNLLRDVLGILRP